jgi:hypothetical protein
LTWSDEGACAAAGATKTAAMMAAIGNVAVLLTKIPPDFGAGRKK